MTARIFVTGMSVYARPLRSVTGVGAATWTKATQLMHKNMQAFR